MRNNEQLEQTDSNRVWKLKHRLEVLRKDRRCTLCPVHGGENFRGSRRGSKKPRYKNKR